MKRLMIHNDTAYVVLREQFIFKFAPSFEAEPDMEKVQNYMQWLKADHVLRTPTHFIFCETIQEIEWEDVPSENIEV